MRDPSEGLGGEAAIRQERLAVDRAAGAHGTSASSGAGGVVADAAGSVVVRRAVTADREGVVRLAEVVDAGERLDALLADPATDQQPILPAV
jgi:hypothetical protein